MHCDGKVRLGTAPSLPDPNATRLICSRCGVIVFHHAGSDSKYSTRERHHVAFISSKGWTLDHVQPRSRPNLQITNNLLCIKTLIGSPTLGWLSNFSLIAWSRAADTWVLPKQQWPLLLNAKNRSDSGGFKFGPFRQLEPNRQTGFEFL